MPENTTTGLNAIEKAELSKRHMLDIFNRNWKKEKNVQNAYDRASKALANEIKRHSITNTRQIAGLKAELFFYKECFETFQLRPEFASGFHADFSGIVNGNPAAFDITTNANVKDASQFKEITDNFRNEREYYLGLVDMETTKVDLNPLTLPICYDKEIGHFMLIMVDSDTESLWANSDEQFLIRYNPKAKDSDSAIEKIIGHYDYLINNPSTILDDLQSELTGEDTRELEVQEMWNNFDSFCHGIVNHFRRESGFVISSIVSSKYVYENKYVPDRYETRKYWVHPHKFIQRSIGTAHQALNHDIAGIIDDF